MPQMVHVMFQIGHFHHHPPLIQPPLVHSIHLWHQKCWTWVVWFSTFICLGVKSSHDYACRSFKQKVSHNYTCKLGLSLWFFLDPLMEDLPHLHPCDSRALLLALYHPSLLFWFWYFSPARRNLKGRSHAHFYCLYLCTFPRNSWPM